MSRPLLALAAAFGAGCLVGGEGGARSALGLAACFVMMAGNLALVSGSNSLIVQAFPWLLLAIGLAGAGLALWLKARKPKVYADLGRTFHVG